MVVPTEASLAVLIVQTFGEKANFVYLLGSAGTDRFHAESDIDLAVHFIAPVDSHQLQEFRKPFEDAFECAVELVSLNQIDPIFARQVLETGRLMLCNSPGLLLNWKVKQLSAYPDFKFTRQVIEKNILNRKRYV
jgi:predicted nucleotidyltransferase